MTYLPGIEDVEEAASWWPTRPAGRVGRAGNVVGRAGNAGVAGFARAAAGAGAAALLTHAVPSVAALRRLRTQLMPALAGIGAPDHVALTFDDGPDPASTPLFLDVLAELDLRATFFVLGTMLERAPHLAERMVDAGHELAVHGWDHRPMLLRGPRSTYRQLYRTRELITTLTGRPPRFVRPPHGILSAGFLLAARRLELTPVLWTAWGRDWTSTATPLTVLDTLTPDLRGGGTVLLHDSDCTSAPQAWHSALGALPEFAARCHDRGLRLGPLAEHGLLPGPLAEPDLRPPGPLATHGPRASEAPVG
ncbi:polysaccharide deacetylase family protein [Protofrankia coriariae]|uniref:Polysaccharide deacetylase n=1 Tax=Protofrankia coriariae TaxID=1562887 RepID=A0ABR5F3G5_9ACTN|nr:polysaccharide deacetylase family protein [Protofrankia coriariae]KLL11232.1 polysaccharide deacetylase [Protofrankia coriariae]